MFHWVKVFNITLEIFMKFYLVVLTLLVWLYPLCAETFYIAPRGDYAKIDIEESNILIDKLSNPETRFVEQRDIAEKVASQPGSYIPPLLLSAGLFFLQQNELERGALLCAAAVNRTQIDIWITEDRSLCDSPIIMMMIIYDAVEQCFKTVEEKSSWDELFNHYYTNFEVWDRATPRNYDQNWIRLHSIFAFNEETFTFMPQEKQQKVIERFYRSLKGEVSEADDEFASKEDAFYFDRHTRIFYHRDSLLSFSVPQKMRPLLDGFGHYSSLILLPNRVRFVLNEGWSAEPYVVEEWYQRKRKYLKEGETISLLEIGRKIPSFQIRKIYEIDSILYAENIFHILNGQYRFTLELNCKIEEEAKCLEILQPLLDSIRFQDSFSDN